MRKKTAISILWDAWCIASIVGIWPRFIEPNLLRQTRITLALPNLERPVRIAQFSDLHLHSGVSDCLLKKIVKRIAQMQPDIVIFSGDFICCSQIKQPERLQAFLNAIPEAPLGNYCTLGNHDYSGYVSINSNGDYDVFNTKKGDVGIGKAFSMLFSNTTLSRKVTENAKRTPFHQELNTLIAGTPFKLLHNQTLQAGHLNITGLGEYTLGKMDPEQAFAGYNNDYPGVVLLHNPDGLPYLDDYPGEVILSGHTHGGQVNIPFLWKKFTLMENRHLKSGLIRHKNKWIYINRGVGSVISFRWFSPPELLELTLEPTHDQRMCHSSCRRHRQPHENRDTETVSSS
ncbi:MAG: UDP-2,3-diacylglucosamine diphosphatase LpxG [Chlamydiales bacterium]|nr:UDP-2,3-diacylglucosamine diphosphatase LpxG [Chlamydiales bacterium]